MANPNIVNTVSILGRTVGSALTTSVTTGILTCSASKILKINSIIAANIDGVGNADVTVSFYDSSTTTSYPIANTITVPANSTLIVLGKDSPIYLEESDEIRGGASSASDINLVISFEEIS
jgi:hypothetical protein